MMMKKFLLLVSILYSLSGFSQQPDTLIKKLDSLSKQTDSAGGQVNNTDPAAYTEATGLNFSSFFILQGSSLKQAFTKPFHMTKRDWKTFGKFAVITGGLFFADKPVQQFALKLRGRNGTLRNLSAIITDFGGPYEGYTLGALGAYGFLSKNKKMQTTTLLALQSYITGATVEGVIKFVSGRQRPFVYDPNAVEAEPAFKGPFKKMYDAQGNKLNSSFPSGHTTVAFAAATVYALEYKDKPWVPIVCYTSASLIGLSRITENKHWVSDVVAGAALGYLTGKLVVNNYHRYARLKSPKRAARSLSFSMGYTNGVLTPGMLYRF